jgi:hypothetical protein
VAVTVIYPRVNVAQLGVTGDVVGGEVAGLILEVQGDATAFFDDEVSALLLPVEGDVDAIAFFLLLDTAAQVEPLLLNQADSADTTLVMQLHPEFNIVYKLAYLSSTPDDPKLFVSLGFPKHFLKPLG